MELVWPARAYLPSYMQALERGWSANTVRPQEAQEELARIAADPDAFLRAKIDRQARGDPVQLPDGSLWCRGLHVSNLLKQHKHAHIHTHAHT